MSITAAIRRMIDAGLTIEQALIAAEAVEAEMPKQRSAGAIRQERYRRNKASHVTVSDACDGCDATPPSPSLPPQTPPSRPHPPVRDIPTRDGASRSELAAEFAEFWGLFPRKAGKGQAEKAFVKARKDAEFAAIIDGTRRYADERRNEDPNFTRHPATWLNGKCWLDEPTPPSATHNNPNQRGRNERAHAVQQSKADQYRSAFDRIRDRNGVERSREPSEEGEWPSGGFPSGRDAYGSRSDASAHGDFRGPVLTLVAGQH